MVRKNRNVICITDPYMIVRGHLWNQTHYICWWYKLHFLLFFLTICVWCVKNWLIGSPITYTSFLHNLRCACFYDLTSSCSYLSGILLRQESYYTHTVGCFAQMNTSSFAHHSLFSLHSHCGDFKSWFSTYTSIYHRAV